MCGVFGLFGEFDPRHVEASLALADTGLYHRGPDSGASVVLGTAALGARRLAVIDRSEQGAQPMHTPDQRHWLVYNGMLYNHRELRDALKPRFAFRGASDTEVVLAALSVWGIGALQRFEGMFALLWWDAHKAELVAAVDPLGIKPLLYRVDKSGGLACSSELGPLVDAFTDSSVDTDALGAYLALGRIDHSRHTLIREVTQLRRGEYLQWRSNQLRIHRYSELIAQESDSLRTPEAATEAVQAALEAAVRRHVVSDLPVGFGLSSGLDSNLLRMVLEQSVPDIALQAFTYTFPGTIYDESQRLVEIDQRAAFETVKVPINPGMVMEHLPTIIGKTLEPIGGLGSFGIAMKYRTAAELGYRVVLNGEGADDLFAGYSYHAHRSVARDAGAYDSIGGRAVLASDGTRLTGPALQPDFFFTPPAAEFGTQAEIDSHSSPLRRSIWADLVALRLPKLLRFRDRLSMHSSIEARVPYLDAGLVRLSLGLSDSQLVRGPVTKAVLRDVAFSVGAAKFSDNKFGNPAPQREWVKGPLGKWALQLLDDSALVKAGIIDAAAFRKQLNDYRATTELGNSFFVWQFANMELWMRAVESRRMNRAALPFVR